jgi:hypothetical protein
MKKLILKGLTIAVAITAIATLSGCGEVPKAGDLCSIPGTAAKDKDGNDLFCQTNPRVWFKVSGR